jgi:hypothetical protein
MILFGRFVQERLQSPPCMALFARGDLVGRALDDNLPAFIARVRS